MRRYGVRSTGTRSVWFDRQTGIASQPMSSTHARQKARDLNAQHYIETGSYTPLVEVLHQHKII